MKLLATIILLAVGAASAGDPAQQEPEAKAAGSQYSAQSTCPVSGMDLDPTKAKSVVYEGQKVSFCCDKCVAKFEAFPDKVLWQMSKKGVRPENTQTTCVISGMELVDGKAQSVWVGNKEIKACCGKCASKIEKDPAPFLDKLEGRKKQTTCPVMGGEVDPEVSSVVQGQKLLYCCAGCDKKAKEDPNAIFAELHKNKVVAEPASDTCVVMGEPVEDKNIFVTYQGRRFYLCCERCLGGFFKKPEAFLAKL